MLSCLYSGLGCVACLRHISVKCDRPLSPALLLALPFSLAPSSGILPERYLSVISTNIFRHPPRSGRWLSNADPGVDPSPRARYGTMWVWAPRSCFSIGGGGQLTPFRWVRELERTEAFAHGNANFDESYIYRVRSGGWTSPRVAPGIVLASVASTRGTGSACLLLHNSGLPGTSSRRRLKPGTRPDEAGVPRAPRLLAIHGSHELRS